MNDYQLQLECDLALKRVMHRVDEMLLDFYYPSRKVDVSKPFDIPTLVPSPYVTQRMSPEIFNRLRQRASQDYYEAQMGLQQHCDYPSVLMGVAGMMQGETNILGSVGFGYNQFYRRR